MPARPLALLALAAALRAAAPAPPPQALLAFVAHPGGAPGVDDRIYLSSADGTGVRRLTQNDFQEGAPTWSPSGDRITFEGYTQQVGIYIVDVVDGAAANQRRLSPSPGFDVRPSFSPDGTRLVYCRILDPNAPGVPPTEIRVMSADGSGSAVILPTGPPPGTFNIEPRWGGPDNDTIVFFANRVPYRQLCFTMKGDGSAVTQITNITCGDPFWSPDGRRISFGSNVEGGGKLNIYTMAPDGSDIVQLTHYDVPWESGDTSWSPDGRTVAFEADKGGNGQSDPNVPAEIRFINSDGSGGETTAHVNCSSVGCSPRFQPRPVAAAAAAVVSDDVPHARRAQAGPWDAALHLLPAERVAEFDARCLDGSAPGYYIRRAEGSVKWKFHVQGGGWRVPLY